MAKKKPARRPAMKPAPRKKIAGPLKVQYIPLAKLKVDEANARTHDERNLDAIRKSIESVGVYQPIVVHAKTFKIIAGHGRREVFEELGIDPVPVVLVNVSDAQAREIALRDNRTAELASWDPEKLQTLLDSLDADFKFSPDELGFSDEELADLGLDVDDAGAATPAGGGEELNPNDQFKILVICKTEREQTKLLEYLDAQGHDCRAMNT